MDYRSAKTRFEQTSKDLADLVNFGSDLATLAKLCSIVLLHSKNIPIFGSDHPLYITKLTLFSPYDHFYIIMIITKTMAASYLTDTIAGWRK